MTEPEQMVVDRLNHLLDQFGDQPFAQLEASWSTWNLVRRIADEGERALTAAGVEPGVSIAVVVRSRPECLAAVFAALRNRRCAVLLSPLSADSALGDELAALAPAAVFAAPEDWARPAFTAAAAGVGAVGLELRNDADRPVLVRARLDRLGQGAHSDQPGAAITVSTSGTTGPPKRLPVDWASFVDMGGGHSPRDPVPGVGAVILSLPLSTLGGAMSIARAVFGGRPLALMERFDVWRWAELVREHRPRVMGAPPPVVSMILEADIPSEYFDGVRAYATGSAPVPPEVARAFEERYGIPVLLSYGATEFLASVTGWTVELYEEFGPAKLGSVGRPLPGVSLRILDEHTGEEVPSGDTGLLQVDPPRRAGGLPDGWLPTADRARLDEDGFLWILGRADDVIIRGGFKVDLGELRAALLEHPEVDDACVVGLSDDRLGQVPGALVTLRSESAGSVSPDQLAQWVRDRLPPYAVPTIVQLGAIPATPTFKHHVAAVRDMLSAVR